jgi:glyoxylase-like metal-dependent hydrolase (beta-lactamase superfamily II)
MKTSKKTTENSVLIYIGGCTGSNVASSERLIPAYETGEVESRYVSRNIFGTNTTSIAILIGKTGIMVDNGTGAEQASEWLKAKGVTQVFILQTHYHFDHAAGLMVNKFLLEKGIVKGIYSPRLNGFTFLHLLDRLYGPPIWPVSPKKFGIEHPIHSFEPGDTLPILGGIKTMLLNHTDGSVAYRIPTPAGDIVIATDNELSNAAIRDEAAKFFSGATLAYVDLQYRDSEYDNKATIGPGHTTMSRKDWGHSTPSMFVQTYELMVKAPTLTLVGHHDPKRSDEDLFRFEIEVRRVLNHLGTVVGFAKEHSVYKLPLNTGD